MKTIMEQLEAGKDDVPIHFNVDTLRALQGQSVNLDCRNVEILRQIVRPELVSCIVERKGESIKSLCESLGIKTTQELKDLLKGMKKV